MVVDRGLIQEQIFTDHVYSKIDIRRQSRTLQAPTAVEDSGEYCDRQLLLVSFWDVEGAGHFVLVA